MADNISIKDSGGSNVTLKTTDVTGGGVHAGNTRITDATAANFMPTMDAAARKGFTAITDGTSTLPLASATTLSATNSGVGGVITTAPGMWAVTHAPSINPAAVASKTAGSAGVRHVCTAVAITLGQSTTGTVQAALIFNLRDGATGAGTILASFTLSSPSATGPTTVLTLSGLNLFGTAATAMTLESASAPAANVYASCSLFGYDVV